MQVRIYKPTKSTTQSGEGSHHWLLEFVTNSNSKFKENLMGRVASSDMSNEVKLKFPTMEEAIDFAQKRNYTFELITPKERKLIKKNYASNFN